MKCQADILAVNFVPGPHVHFFSLFVGCCDALENCGEEGRGRGERRGGGERGVEFDSLGDGRGGREGEGTNGCDGLLGREDERIYESVSIILVEISGKKVIVTLSVMGRKQAVSVMGVREGRCRGGGKRGEQSKLCQKRLWR